MEEEKSAREETMEDSEPVTGEGRPRALFWLLLFYVAGFAALAAHYIISHTVIRY